MSAKHAPEIPKPQTSITKNGTAAPKRRQSATRASPERLRSWKPEFLEALKKCPNVSAAMETARVSRPLVYAERKRSGVFRAAWDNAIAIGVEGLERNLHRYAVDGLDVQTDHVLPDEVTVESLHRFERGPDGKPRAIPYTRKKTTYRVVRTVTKQQSVAAATFLLKRLKPEVYGDTVRVGNAVAPATGQPEVFRVEANPANMPTEELESLAAEAVARGLAPALPPDVDEAGDGE